MKRSIIFLLSSICVVGCGTDFELSETSKESRKIARLIESGEYVEASRRLESAERSTNNEMILTKIRFNKAIVELKTGRCKQARAAFLKILREGGSTHLRKEAEKGLIEAIFCISNADNHEDFVTARQYLEGMDERVLYRETFIEEYGSCEGRRDEKTRQYREKSKAAEAQYFRGRLCGGESLYAYLQTEKEMKLDLELKLTSDLSKFMDVSSRLPFGNIRMTVEDEAGNTLSHVSQEDFRQRYFSAQAASNEEYLVLRNVLLPRAGRYYVKLSSDYHSEALFDLSVGMRLKCENRNDSFENNDSFERAFPLEPVQSVAQSCPKNDDWYRFSVQPRSDAYFRIEEVRTFEGESARYELNKVRSDNGLEPLSTKVMLSEDKSGFFIRNVGDYVENYAVQFVSQDLDAQLSLMYYLFGECPNMVAVPELRFDNLTFSRAYTFPMPSSAKSHLMIEPVRLCPDFALFYALPEINPESDMRWEMLKIHGAPDVMAEVVEERASASEHSLVILSSAVRRGDAMVLDLSNVVADKSRIRLKSGSATVFSVELIPKNVGENEKREEEKKDDKKGTSSESASDREPAETKDNPRDGKKDKGKSGGESDREDSRESSASSTEVNPKDRVDEWLDEIERGDNHPIFENVLEEQSGGKGYLPW